MKNAILAIASFLTAAFLFTQTAVAASEGGNVLAGDNPYDTSVPGSDGQGVGAPGFVCATCTTHVSGTDIQAHTNPGATAAAAAGGTTTPGTGTNSNGRQR